MKGIVIDIIVFLLFLVIVFTAILFMYMQVSSKFRVYQIKFGEKILSDTDTAYRGAIMGVSSSLYFSAVNGIQDYLNGIDASPEQAVKKWLYVTNKTLGRLSTIYQKSGITVDAEIYPQSLVLDMENGTASVKYKITIDAGYAWLNDTEYTKMDIPEIKEVQVPFCSGHAEKGDIVVDLLKNSGSVVECGAYNKSIIAGYIQYDCNGRINQKKDLMSSIPCKRHVSHGNIVWTAKYDQNGNRI